MNIPDTKIALTLFNLRDYAKTAEDLDTTLARIKDMGYEAVQVSAISLHPEKVKELLDKHKLYCCATHEGLPALRDNFKEIVLKMKLWECDFTALGHPGDGYWSTQGIEILAKELDQIGSKFKAEGIKFGYHNHHSEFQKDKSKVFLEDIYDRTNPENLYSELDVHWVARGGQNPVKWIYKLKGRMSVIHFKDFAIINNTEPAFCEIGEGNLDWEEILKACEETKIRWYVVEQDATFKDKDIFESMKISINNLKQMGVK